MINCYAELLLGNLPNCDLRREQVTAILNAGKKVAGLTAQLLAFSRKAIVESKILDLNHVIESASRLLRRLIGEDLILTVTPKAGYAQIRIDQAQLEQVIMNLVVNARDAMPDGGQLTVETSNVTIDELGQSSYPGLEPGHYVCLLVCDTGHGMNDEIKRQIFEPFFTTKEIGKGTGLGLAVVHGIVQQCGGHVRVETAPGVGTNWWKHCANATPVCVSFT